VIDKKALPRPAWVDKSQTPFDIESLLAWFSRKDSDPSLTVKYEFYSVLFKRALKIAQSPIVGHHRPPFEVSDGLSMDEA
jgi:hypothetical protein